MGYSCSVEIQSIGRTLWAPTLVKKPTILPRGKTAWGVVRWMLVVKTEGEIPFRGALICHVAKGVLPPLGALGVVRTSLMW